MKHKLTLALAALLLPLSVAATEPAKETRAIGVEASIAFPSFGTIRNFEADGDDGVWIEDMRRNWYYAALTGYCPDLDFVQTIGIDTRGTARLDRFGAIIVKGERCAITSFVTATKPLPRKERLKLEQAARDAKVAEAS